MKAVLITLLYLLSLTHENFGDLKNIKPGKGIILLTYYGYNPKTPTFNLYAHLSPSMLDRYDQEKIQEKLEYYFSDFDVTFTQDDSLFYTYPVDHRIRVVITRDTLEGYNTGGLSFYNSLHRNDTSASLVTSSGFSYVDSTISQAIAHEVGHQLGLLHQSKWFLCFKIKEYNDGTLEKAPLMGRSYDAKKAEWWKGFNSRLRWQDDKKVISRVFQLRSK